MEAVMKVGDVLGKKDTRNATVRMNELVATAARPLQAASFGNCHTGKQKK
jgi:hypothetical protein